MVLYRQQITLQIYLPQILNPSAVGNLSSASLQGVALWEHLYTYTISGFIHNVRQNEL